MEATIKNYCQSSAASRRWIDGKGESGVLTPLFSIHLAFTKQSIFLQLLTTTWL